MNLLHLFVVLSAVANFSGSLLYVRAMTQGRAQPNRVTWFLWALIPLIAFFASVWEGSTWSSVSIFMSGLIPLVVFLASFFIRGAYWKITLFDLGCGVLSLAAVVLWALTQDGFFAVALAILADALAGFPTLVKCWRFPETEVNTTYIGGFVSAGFGLLSVQEWRFVEYGFPLYLATICLVFIAVIGLRGHKNKLRQRLSL